MAIARCQVEVLIRVVDRFLHPAADWGDPPLEEDVAAARRALALEHLHAAENLLREPAPQSRAGRKVTWGGVPPVGVVTLCGSTRFREQFDAENMRLTLEGYIVLSCGVWDKTTPGVEVSDEQKKSLDLTHKRKIDLSDGIHVINVDGYTGESTRSEITYAQAHGKRITYLEPLS